MAEEKSRRKIQSSSITTLISVSLVLFLLGLLGILFISAKKISNHLKENIGFHVYLKENAKDDEVVNQLVDVMSKYAGFSKEERIANMMEARKVASMADWKSFVRNYIEAHNFAVDKVYK